MLAYIAYSLVDVLLVIKLVCSPILLYLLLYWAFNFSKSSLKNLKN